MALRCQEVFCRTVLFIVLQGWDVNVYSLSPRVAPQLLEDLCLWIKGRLVCKIDLRSQISIERSAKAYIRFSLKMMRLKCTLKCQYVLTHFAELGSVIVHSVLQKSYLPTLNILFILLLLGVPGRDFRLTEMSLKLHFNHNSDTHMEVFFRLISFTSIY